MPRLRLRLGVSWSLLLLVVAGPVRAEMPAAVALTPAGEVDCARYFPEIERREGIPAGLLASIAAIESGGGGLGDAAGAGWPWTINVQGEGHFFAGKADAVAEVRRLQAAGLRSIDVGCMQVNLLYHPTAFASIEDAFDPRHNVAYAGRFLRSLREATRSWPEAVARYHSADPLLGGDYRRKVMAAWTGEAPTPAWAARTPSFQRVSAVSVQVVRTPWGPVRIFRPTAPASAADQPAGGHLIRIRR